MDLTNTSAVTIESRAEHDIDAGTHRKIHRLLAESFPGYPSRSYFKQLPHLRYLAWEGDGDTLVAHVGIDHRMIRNGDTPLRVFGIVDVCVAASARSRGMASSILSDIETTARSSGADALLLFADDPRLYLANGYQQVSNDAKWLMLHEHETFGIAEKPVSEMMVKMLSDDPWGEGAVDLLGYLF
ncbi:GNAT family N-acetyltransferase [Streptomyces sp. NPDC057682]|uniref:GNAT family N-acetyltransferase n=1 Tax=unclassified Streptomyces TaxID=2593676 RepID=UPI00364AB034